MKSERQELEILLGRASEFHRLKDVVRTGWELRGVRDPESVADHSWGTAMLILLFASIESVDVNRAVAIAIVHDLAEVEVGDIPRRVRPGSDAPSPEEKSRRERAAMERLTALGPVDERLRDSAIHIRALWDEYEAGVTREAQFVRDMNLLDMCLQAVEYESSRRYEEDGSADHFPEFRRLDEFFATSEPRFQTDSGRKLFEIAFQRYQEVRKN